MERKFSLEKPSEETTRSTGKSGPPPWLRQYTYQEEPINDQRPLHGDPRDKHDNDFSDDDSDHGYGHPGVGLGPMSDFYASTSFASDQGTLAGRGAVYEEKAGEHDQGENKRFWAEHDREYTRKQARDNWNKRRLNMGHISKDGYNSYGERSQKRWEGTVDNLLTKHFDAFSLE